MATLPLTWRDRAALVGRAVSGSLALDPESVGGRLLHGVLQGGGTPPPKGTNDFLRAYSHMPWLRAVASRVSYDVAATQWHLLVERRQGRVRMNRLVQRAGPAQRRVLLDQLKAEHALEVLETHPLIDLLDRANPVQIGLMVRRVTQLHLDLVGEAFWLLERGATPVDVPVAIWPIPPSWILSLPTPRQPFYRASFRGWQGMIPATEFIAFADIDPLNPYGRGTGTAQALRDELEADEYACHDEHTECLTRRGWIKGLDLTLIDEIATWDESRHQLEYQVPTEVMQYDYDGELHHWHGRSLDACVTPTHRLWVYRANRWRFETSRFAGNPQGKGSSRWLGKGNAGGALFFVRDAAFYRGADAFVDIAPVARITKRKPGSRGGGRPPKYGVNERLLLGSYDFARFLGYYISEGSPNRAAVTLAQAEGRYVDDIRASLSIFPVAWITERRTARPQKGWKPIYRWSICHLGLSEWLRHHVGCGAYHKRIPICVFEWGHGAQAELFDGLMNGDGHWVTSPHGVRSGTYVTRSAGLADDVQRLCVQLGYSSLIRKIRNRGAILHTVHIRFNGGMRRVEKTNGAWSTTVPYKGKVWCASVSNDTIITRRNGCVLISGNSKHLKSFYYNSARPDLIVWPKGENTTLRAEEVARLEEQWNRENRGFWRAFRTYFLRREVGIKELETSFRAQQFTQVREFERDAVFQVYGVSPETLGVIRPGASRATITMADSIYSRRVLVPRLELLRSVMQERLLPLFDERLILDYESPVVRDHELELDAGKAAPWAMTMDEWRVLQGQEAKPNGQGQVHFVPFQLQAVSDFGQTAASLMPPSPREAQRIAPLLTEQGQDAAVCDEAGDYVTAGRLRLFAKQESESDDLFPESTSDDPIPTRIADRVATGYRRAQEAAWRAVSSGADRVAAERAIAVGRPDEVLEALGGQARLNLALIDPLHTHGRRAFLRGAQLALEGLPVVPRREPVGVDLADVNPEATRWAEAEAGRLITGAADVEAIRALMVESNELGIAPREVARWLIDDDLIGLLPRQVTAVTRVRAALVAQGLAASVVQSRTARYAAAQLRYRAWMIARTESVAAVNNGQQALWQLAKRRGVLPAGTRRRWLVTDDDRLDLAICFPLMDAEAGLDEPFEPGGFMTPPAHPACRCAVGLASIPKRRRQR